jgi:hypothetical protein
LASDASGRAGASSGRANGGIGSRRAHRRRHARGLASAGSEATSALHVAAQAELMPLTAGRLPGLTLISIGHRPELESLHERKVTMQAAPAGARIVADEPIDLASSISPVGA